MGGPYGVLFPTSVVGSLPRPAFVRDLLAQSSALPLDEYRRRMCAAIGYADAMTTDPHTITDEQVEDLRRRFGDDGVVELTYQIGVENMRARMYSALGITEQGFNSGDACRVPWATEGQDAAASR